MNMLQGILQMTYDAFDSMVSKSCKMLFVRSNKDKDKGCVFFGDRMYGTADIYSSDESVKVEFDGKCGIDLKVEQKQEGTKWIYY